MPSNLAALPPSIAILSLSLRPGSVEDVIDEAPSPRERIIGAEHDLAHADREADGATPPG